LKICETSVKERQNLTLHINSKPFPCTLGTLLRIRIHQLNDAV